MDNGEVESITDIEENFQREIVELHAATGVKPLLDGIRIGVRDKVPGDQILHRWTLLDRIRVLFDSHTYQCRPR